MSIISDLEHELSSKLAGDDANLAELDHGREVAFEVEKRLSSCFDSSTAELLLIAALLHSSSVGSEAAVPVGGSLTFAGFASRLLAGRLRSEAIDRVVAVIDEVGSTLRRYPSPDRLGGATIVGGSAVVPAEIEILRASDAIVHMRDPYVRYQLLDWERQGLAAGDAKELGVPSWMSSIKDNQYLLGRRFLIDCHALLLAGDQEAVATAQHFVRQSGLHDPDLHDPTRFAKDREMAISRTRGEVQEWRLTASTNSEILYNRLREVVLVGDSKSFPYEVAHFEEREFEIESVRPLSLYVLRDQVDLAKDLFDRFMVGYALSPFRLSGIVAFTIDSGEEQMIAPPVIEALPEADGGGYGLVDGIHRFFAAGELGFSSVNSVVIHGAGFPLVPLPARWEEVILYESGSGPLESDKRHYRFEAFDEFPRATHPTATASSFQYFFFRDLSALGSSGKRNFKLKQ